MTYQYRDPRKCTGYVPAEPPRVVFRRNVLDPFQLELFIALTSELSPVSA